MALYLKGGFSAWRLHKFVPRDSTELAEHQEEFMKQVNEEDVK